MLVSYNFLLLFFKLWVIPSIRYKCYSMDLISYLLAIHTVVEFGGVGMGAPEPFPRWQDGEKSLRGVRRVALNAAGLMDAIALIVTRGTQWSQLSSQFIVWQSETVVRQLIGMLFICYDKAQMCYPSTKCKYNDDDLVSNCNNAAHGAFTRNTSYC